MFEQITIEGKKYNLVPAEEQKRIFICEIDGKKYYLGPEADKKMSWGSAMQWAKDVGGILMPREVAIMAYKKDEIRKYFKKDTWYWLCEGYGFSVAWYQSFVNGYQDGKYKDGEYYVRAVFVE